METFIYKNINFNYHNVDVSREEYGEDIIGLTKLTIPENHVKGMFRSGYYVETEFNNKIYKVLPHLDIYNYENDNKIIGLKHEIIDCVNTDLIIVYFKWLLERKRKVTIDIESCNPYWIFHDLAHIDDVHGTEVCSLNANLEQYRLDQGIEFMLESNYIPSFTYEYINRMEESFYTRWKVKLDTTLFNKYCDEEEYYDE